MITIGEYSWQRMLAAFAEEPRAVEQVCYFDGVVFAGHGIVTTVTIPNAALFEGRFEVSADAMSQAGRHLRGHQLRRLAQVHTHPSGWTGHSPWDDAHAYSQQPGAISIVLPNFGRGRPALHAAGVHLRGIDGWRELRPDELASVIRVVPTELDFRAVAGGGRPTDERTGVKSARRRSWWAAVAFWRRA